MAPFAIAPLFAFLFDPFTAAAVAGGAVSIPIVIHLLNRKRYRIVPWAAMRFLLAAQRKTSRKVRIEQILLLVVRCLLVLLLLLAMCSVTGWAESWFWRPFAGQGFAAAGGAARTHKILVVDGSLGMGFKAKPDDPDCFEKAKAAAKQIVKESNGGDGFSVVLLADPPRMIVPGPTEDPDPGAPSEDADRVLSRLDALQPTHGNADLAAALTTVEDLLKASPKKYAEKEVYFLSNLQRSTWLARGASVPTATPKQDKSHAGTAVVLDVARIDDGKGQEVRMSNLAVERLSLTAPIAVANQDVLIQAYLHNFGATRYKVVVHLRVGKVEADGQPPDLHEVAASEEVAEIKDGEQVPVTMRYKFSRAGDYVAQVEVKPDGLAADDARRVVVSVKEKVRVLLVDGKHAARPSDGAAALVRLALNPYSDEAAAVENNVVARTKIIDDKAFADEGLGDLSGYDCVFLCDMPRFTDGEARRLVNHVRDGGGVVFVAGDRVDFNEYNNLLSPKGVGLLPVRLVSKQTETDAYSFHWTPQPDMDAEPAFKPFTVSRPRDALQVPFFQAFLRVESALDAPSGAAGKTAPVHTLMTFKAVPLHDKPLDKNAPADGPAVLEWRPPNGVGATARDRLPGHVVLVTTTLNGDWDHLGINPQTPVFIDRLMQFAASGRLLPQSIDVGEPMEWFTSNASGGPAVIHTPDGRKESVPVRQLDDGSVVYWQGADVSGVYSITLGDSTHLVAVNPPALNTYQGQASDLTRAAPDDVKSAFPGWDLQLVTDLHQVKHASGGVGYREPDPIGPGIAHVLLLILLGLFFVEVVLAWLFGHYTAVAPLAEEAARATMTRRRWLATRLPLYLLSALFIAALVGVGFVLIHYAFTGDFLSFLPDGFRAWWEGRPPLAAGESRRWTLAAASVEFWNSPLDPWLHWIVLGLGIVLVVAVYAREGRKVGVGHRVLMTALRLGLLWLLMRVMMPQLRVWYERQAAPDLVLILDDSKSMSTVDKYRDPKIQEAADALAKQAGLSEADRLRLAQTIVTRPQGDWLRTLLTKRNVRLHIYHCSSRLHRLADVTKPEDLGDAAAAIQTLPTEPPRNAASPAAGAPDRAARFAPNDSTQIGTAVRQVLAEYNASALAGIVVLTDGVSTEGESLDHVADAARDQGVPLFFVGIGDANEMHNLRLYDVQAVDSVYVNDHIVFDLMVKGVGYPGLTVPVTLKEKGKDEVLDKKDVTLPTGDDDVKVQLQYKPTEAGARTFVIETPLRPDESDKEDNRVERKVYVREAKLIHVLYVEGYRRYEYHFLKTLLERESDRIQNNKTMQLKVVLMSADPGYEDEDRNALKDIPSKEELNGYDVILLGDVDPHPKENGEKMTEHLKDIAEWVTDHGGGLLMIAGERYAPFAYRDSPLKDVLPVEVVADHLPDEANVERTEGFRPELTPDGERHPIFRFEADAGKNKEAWDHLREMYWWSSVCIPKRNAEVLASHPTAKGPADKDRPSDRQALVVTQFVGAGRSMFLGFGETWRWGFREDQRRYNQFWIQIVRYLSGSRHDDFDLYLDRDTAYRRGEPIKVMVRYPNDRPPPDKDAEVEVKLVRRGLDGGGDPVEDTLKLTKVEGSRGVYSCVVTKTPEGRYQFTLTKPAVADPRPTAECKVLAPPGEMDQLQMNQREMEAAAQKTHGGFYTITNADDLVSDKNKNLRSDARVRLQAPVGTAWPFWAFPVFFLLAVMALTTEWILRKQKNLV